MEEEKRAAAAASLAESIAILESTQRRLIVSKSMMNEVKAGRASAPLYQVEKFQMDLLSQECDARVAIDEARKILGEKSPTFSASECTKSDLSVKTLASSDNNNSGKRMVQTTLASFLMVTSGDGRIRPLGGAKMIAQDRLSCKGEGCSKTFKDINGLREHERWCKGYKSLAQQTSALVKKARLENVESALTRHAEEVIPSSDEKPSMEVVGLDDDNSGDETENKSAHVSEPTSTEKKKVPQKKGVQRGMDKRVRYSVKFKYDIATLVEGAKSDLGKSKGAITLIADKTGVAEANVRRWYNEREELHRVAQLSKGKKGRGNRGFMPFNVVRRGIKPPFQVAEALVLVQFGRARAAGVRVGPTLVKVWMRRAVKKLCEKNVTAGSFKASNHWLHNFLRRNQLCERRATNKKEISFEERLPKVQRWHKRWQRDVSAGPEADPVFGRYLPRCIMNSDQVPFSIGDVVKTTYEHRGAKHVRYSQQKGSDKRMATLQLCLSLDGSSGSPVPQCRPTIIFRGKGNISQQEREAYDSRVAVLFQEKAWMDSKLFEKWVNGPLKEHVEKNLPAGPKVMVLDNLQAQANDTSEELLRSIGVDRRLLPAGVTDMMQPVDRNVGVAIKRGMMESLQNRLVESDDFRKRWLGTDGEPTFPAKDKRIVLTQLLGETWERFCANKDLLALGLSTGCVMPKLGIDRSHPRIGGQRISMPGVKAGEEYSFEDIELETATADKPSAETDDLEDNEKPLPDVSKCVAVPKKPSKRKHPAIQASTDEEEIDTCDLLEPIQLKDQAEDDLKITEDPDPLDTLLDDTDVLDDEEFDVNPPQGFEFETAPTTLPPISAWKGRMVYWRAELPNGEHLDWIKVKVEGGPADPSQALCGVTMRLKCSKRFDANTPKCYLTKSTCDVHAALTPNNYGKKWFLLKEA